MWHQFIKLLTISLITASVTACQKEYAQPEFRGSMPFSGAQDFVGSSGDRVRIIMTHGMCTEQQLGFDFGTGGRNGNWVGARTEAIAKIIGDNNYKRLSSFPPTRIYYERENAPAVYRYDVDLKSPDGTIFEIRMLKYGMAWWDGQRALDALEDYNQSPPVKRALINDRLKQVLMDDCLVDAVAYTGAKGNTTRAAFREAICELMGGNISGANKGIPREKVDCTDAKTYDNTPTLIVPQSLGSKVMMDAINSVDGTGTLGDVRAFHLLTNQLPLLSQGEIDLANRDNSMMTENEQLFAPAGASEFRDMIDKLQRTSMKSGGAGDFEVIVYNDPNDVLSYPLSEAWVPVDSSLTNVLISNAPTYLGLFENPLDAHNGVIRTDIYRMILGGSDRTLAK